MEIGWESSVGSNTIINKKTLLKTEYTPADYLLSYSKLFGLYFIKDVKEKKITILSRGSFFKNKTID